MPVGRDFVERVAALLKADEGISITTLQSSLRGPPTRRAIRYAITALVAQNRARRGPLRNPGGRAVFAVAAAPVQEQQAAE